MLLSPSGWLQNWLTESRSQNQRTGDIIRPISWPRRGSRVQRPATRELAGPSPSGVALQDQAEVAELVPEVSGGNRLSVGTHEERLVEEGTQEVEVTGLRLVESGQQPVDRPQR